MLLEQFTYILAEITLLESLKPNIVTVQDMDMNKGFQSHVVYVQVAFYLTPMDASIYPLATTFATTLHTKLSLYEDY